MPGALVEELQKILPQNRLRLGLLDRVSFASDAGFYYMIPQAVVQPANEQEIIALFRLSQAMSIPLVFRAAGTSLSGQSITDGILVDLSQNWKGIRVEEEGQQVRTQPGITGAMVNAHLKKFRRKIGPDPSSISAAMMGGIISNNSSGMCCGVSMNAYHTTRYIRFILPSGNAYTTEDPADYDRFLRESAELSGQLAGIRTRILDNTPLRDRIRKKYLTKNTIGYSLNAFIDYEHPLDIMAHLLVGAEGTLAFISEAVLHTVPDHPYKSTSLLFFPTIYDACAAIVPLTNAGAMMVELMDRASLRAVEEMEGIPAAVKGLPPTAAALLIEFQEMDPLLLDQRVTSFLSGTSLHLLSPPEFTKDPRQQDLLWKIRKGLFPAVGAVRASGTTVILEDIAVPVDKLGDAILDLQQLFIKHDYPEAIIFGHAKDGNIHFMVTQSLNEQHDVDRYDRFMRDVVELVVGRYDGALKAEHGTGRNMAPFVETEWGGEAYEIIRTIKKICDPLGLLNPGVIVNDDAEAHIRNLKKLPTVEEEVDRCIECGYCEHKCPSRDITTTPRRRIVARRVLKSLELEGNRNTYAQLLQEYQYNGLDTCAVDGLCATACPVDINTGDLVKRLRRENHSPAENKRALWVARNFAKVEKMVRLALRCGTTANSMFGKGFMAGITGLLKNLGMPAWTEQIPAPPSLKVLNTTPHATPELIYFPSCISRTMGSYESRERNIMETFLGICEKTGIRANVLPDASGACCSQIFSSKGYTDAYRYTANNIIDRLWNATRQGSIPVVIDVSSCAYTLRNIGTMLDNEGRKKFMQLQILDAVDLLWLKVVPKTIPRRKAGNIVLHPVCSLEKMKTTDRFIQVARHFAEKVTVPVNAGCCGMAGDRGFLFPELTESATRAEAEEVREVRYDGYYSSTKTCEMALSQAVKENYLSILYLVDDCL